VVVASCERIRQAGGSTAVALSGGTFQNMLLLEQVVGLLEEKGFDIYRHRRVPANDGGLALGQAILADRTSREQS
jgi:hydrogenase maturation protein HypF